MLILFTFLIQKEKKKSFPILIRRKIPSFFYDFSEILQNL